MIGKVEVGEIEAEKMLGEEEIGDVMMAEKEIGEVMMAGKERGEVMMARKETGDKTMYGEESGEMMVGGVKGIGDRIGGVIVVEVVNLHLLLVRSQRRRWMMRGLRSWLGGAEIKLITLDCNIVKL